MSLNDHVLDRLDGMRRETVRAGIDGALDTLTNPLLSPAQRAAWGESYMQCVVAQLDDLDRQIDDRVWSLLTRAVAA